MVNDHQEVNANSQREDNLEVGMSINDILVGNVMNYSQNRDTDELIILLGLLGKQIGVLLNSGAAYNIIDINTANTLYLKGMKLSNDAHTITGCRLSITAKVILFHVCLKLA